MTNVEVQRHGNENIGGLMRRYSRKMQSSGVVRRAKSLRYFKRKPSAASIKKSALNRIEKTKNYVGLYKEGREPEEKRRR